MVLIRIACEIYVASMVPYVRPVDILRKVMYRYSVFTFSGDFFFISGFGETVALCF